MILFDSTGYTLSAFVHRHYTSKCHGSKSVLNLSNVINDACKSSPFLAVDSDLKTLMGCTVLTLVISIFNFSILRRRALIDCTLSTLSIIFAVVITALMPFTHIDPFLFINTITVNLFVLVLLNMRFLTFPSRYPADQYHGHIVNLLHLFMLNLNYSLQHLIFLNPCR